MRRFLFKVGLFAASITLLAFLAFPGGALAQQPAYREIGQIVLYPAQDINLPYGYLLCNGQAVSRTGIYAGLFAIIGEVYGAGNGTTTFNLPNFVERFPLGAEVQGYVGDPASTVACGNQTCYTILGYTGGESQHTLTIGEMAIHSHDVPTRNIYATGGTNSGAWGGTTVSAGKTNNTGSGQAANNMPRYIAMNYLIAYTTAYTSAAPTATPTTQPTYTPWPTYTPQPTYTPRPISATYTPEPTYTPWPTYTPEPTYTPNPAAPTYTPMPTYTPASGSGAIVCPDFPSTGILDDFNRADEGPPPGENWSSPPPAVSLDEMITINNGLRGEDDYTYGHGMAIFTGTFTNSLEVYITISDFVGDDEIELIFGQLGTSNGYSLRFSTGGVYLLNSESTLGSENFTMSDGDSVGMRIVDGMVDVFYKPVDGEWSELFLGSDSQDFDGQLIVGTYNNSLFLDDFGGGHITCQYPTAMVTPDAYTHTLGSGHTVYLPITMSFGQIYTSILAIPVVLVMLSLIMIRVFR